MAQKSIKQLINFIFWSAGCSLLSAEGFSCSLDVLYGGLFAIFFKKIRKKINCIFCNFLSSKPWIRIWIRIRFRIHLKCWIRIRIRIRILWILIYNTTANRFEILGGLLSVLQGSAGREEEAERHGEQAEELRWGGGEAEERPPGGGRQGQECQQRGQQSTNKLISI